MDYNESTARWRTHSFSQRHHSLPISSIRRNRLQIPVAELICTTPNYTACNTLGWACSRTSGLFLSAKTLSFMLIEIHLPHVHASKSHGIRQKHQELCGCVCVYVCVYCHFGGVQCAKWYLCWRKSDLGVSKSIQWHFKWDIYLHSITSLSSYVFLANKYAFKMFRHWLALVYCMPLADLWLKSAPNGFSAMTQEMC